MRPFECFPSTESLGNKTRHANLSNILFEAQIIRRYLSELPLPKPDNIHAILSESKDVDDTQSSSTENEKLSQQGGKDNNIFSNGTSERGKQDTSNNGDAHVLIPVDKKIDSVPESFRPEEQSGDVLKHDSCQRNQEHAQNP